MFRLTKRSVEALELRGTDYIEWDRDVAGFGVRVYPSGKKAYLVQYRSGRRTRRYTIGSHGVLTADQARAEAKRLLGDVLRGEDPSGTRRNRRQAPTVKALCERFQQDYAAVHCKPSTNRSYEMLIRLHIKPALGPMLIQDVTRADVAALHLKLSADAPYQANRVLALLSKLFSTAEDWGLRAEGTNPARRIKKNREEEKKRYLSDDEQMRLGRILNEVDSHPKCKFCIKTECCMEDDEWDAATLT